MVECRFVSALEVMRLFDDLPGRLIATSALPFVAGTTSPGSLGSNPWKALVSRFVDAAEDRPKEEDNDRRKES